MTAEPQATGPSAAGAEERAIEAAALLLTRALAHWTNPSGVTEVNGDLSEDAAVDLAEAWRAIPPSTGPAPAILSLARAVIAEYHETLDRAARRCAFSVADRACGLPLGHDGVHETWGWLCERHHSWLCQAGQGKCQVERFGVCEMAACGRPAVYCLVGEAGDLWFCERHRPADVAAPTPALTTRGA